jgi:hypothetical protein
MKSEKKREGGREARGRGDSASQLRLPLLLSRQGAAEGFHPPGIVHLLGRLGVDDFLLRRRAGRFCSRNSTVAFGGGGRLRPRQVLVLRWAGGLGRRRSDVEDPIAVG